MTDCTRKTVVWVLALAVVLMLGVTTGSAFAHEIQHAAHHTAGMHSSGICAWMCAATGTQITPTLQPQEYHIVHAALCPDEFISFSQESLTRLFPRAPPTR